MTKVAINDYKSVVVKEGMFRDTYGEQSTPKDIEASCPCGSENFSVLKARQLWAARGGNPRHWDDSSFSVVVYAACGLYEVPFDKTEVICSEVVNCGAYVKMGMDTWK